jgi:predicted CXXCH cytochrome family protein
MSRRTGVLLRRMTVAGVLGACACGGWSPATVLDETAVCPNDLPTACPSAVPSFSRDVQPVMQGQCGTCHSASGTAPDHRFLTYTDAFSQRSAFLNQVYSCKMPPPGAVEGLSVPSRELVLTWLVCNAPNN